MEQRAGDRPLYELLAELITAEEPAGVATLVGDANLDLMLAVERAAPGLAIDLRHENTVVAVADGMARASGTVAVATVTSGPGLTQTATSLVCAARQGSRVVVIAGDIGNDARPHLQRFDIAAFAAACECAHLRVESVAEALPKVSRAFHLARSGRPVVLTLPMSVQTASTDLTVADYRPSATMHVAPQRPRPDAELLATVASRLAASVRPAIVLGRGAAGPGAVEAVRELAARLGAPVGTTLLAKGAADDLPTAIGVVGGYSSPEPRAVMERADLVLLLGTSSSVFMTRGGASYPDAVRIQVDLAPTGWSDWSDTADLHLVADAGETVRDLLALLPTQDRPAWAGPVRTGEQPWQDVTVRPDPSAPGLAPRDVAAALQREVPTDADVVIGTGHFWSFVVDELRGRRPERLTYAPLDFGSIGQAIGLAIGTAAVRRDGLTVLVEGDGSLLTHVQELEPIARHRLPMVVVVFNDGGYGAEAHKADLQGASGGITRFGFTDLGGVASALGLDGRVIRDHEGLTDSLGAACRDRRPTLLDVRLRDDVISGNYAVRMVPQD